MELDRQPLVSIGVPVFNGEAGLSDCLASLLKQTYSNLEIVISDNASTDSTPSICERYVQMDTRVKYFRADRNRGASWNFNRVFELSSGKYFMWAAHDDEREPGFVGACVRRMEECPEAVLCQTRTAVSILGQSGTLYIANLDSFDVATEVVARYREALRHLPATAMYGLYRSSAVRATKLWQKVIATDIAFIQEMSIHGRFVQVPEILFNYTGRPAWNTVHQDIRHFLGIERKPWWYVPFLLLFLNHSSRLWSAPIPWWLKARLWSVLVFHHAKQALIKVILRLTGAVCPELRKEAVGWAMYRRWLLSPNLEIVSQDPFLDRVCKPQLGWWR